MLILALKEVRKEEGGGEIVERVCIDIFVGKLNNKANKKQTRKEE